MHEYVGNLHLHSTFSDGSKRVEEIAQEAHKEGLDFIIFNDHNTLRGLREGKEGFYGKVLALIGSEVGRDYNHYLCFGIEKEVAPDNLNPQRIIDEVNEQGGLGFLAHPFEKGTPLYDDGHAFIWKDWSVQGFTGICIWNYSSAWKEQITTIPRALFYYLFRKATPIDPSPATLKKWDEECKKGRVVAIGGSDNHAVTFQKGPLRAVVFPYRHVFRAINTHILLEEKREVLFSRARAQIYQALREGQCYVACSLFGDARGFRFSIEGREDELLMGKKVPFNEGRALWTFSPQRAIIRLVKDGVPLALAQGQETTFYAPAPGVYRVELYRKSLFGKRRAWLFSNPIYLM